MMDIKNSLRNAESQREILSKKEFSNLARAVVRYFYGDGQKQIQIINRLIELSASHKGINTAKLVLWLQNVIPHEVVGNSSQLRFGKRIKKSEYARYEEYLLEAPHYFDCGENTKKVIDKKLSLDKLLKSSVDIDTNCILSSETQLRKIRKLIHDLELIVAKSKAAGSVSGQDVPDASFVSGGLPSLGKGRP